MGQRNKSLTTCANKHINWKQVLGLILLAINVTEMIHKSSNEYINIGYQYKYFNNTQRSK